MLGSAPFHCHRFPWALSPALGLMDVFSTSSCPLLRLSHGSFYMLYVEGPVLASWPPGSFPCSVAPLQDQLIFFWQHTLTCIMVNPSHSQETDSPEMILVTAKTIHRAARSELTFDCFKQCAMCSSWHFKNGLYIGSYGEGKCHFPDLTVITHWGGMSTRHFEVWSNHRKGICLDGLRVVQCSINDAEGYNYNGEERSWKE